MAVGEGGEGRNITHNQKKLNEDELREFRTRFGIPISDESVLPKRRSIGRRKNSPEMVYLRERREAHRWFQCRRGVPKPVIDVRAAIGGLRESR